MSHLKNWQEEKRSVYLYEQIALDEKDPVRKKLFLELAAGANMQASIWANNLKKSGEEIPSAYHPDVRTRLVARLVKYFGAEKMRFILSAMKVRGMSIYAMSPNGHNHSPHHTPHIESQHRGLNTAGNLRAAVFGVNDGLISNASLMLGVVGGNASHSIIVLSGVAGLLAGACSMAAGEYISMRSQREFFEYQIQLEKEELELYPEEEAAELAAIYRARGLSKEDAQKLADHMISDPATALDTLAKEELGINPAELGSPMGATVSSFISFALGALIPLLPFLISSHTSTLFVSIALTAIALTVIGATLSLFTNKNAILSGLRMLLIGCMAGGATYLIGKLLGTALF